MTTQTEITQRNHRRAVRFFWCLLIGATTVSLLGNVVHAILAYIPHVVIQIGAAAIPPIALLAAVHGIALAVRAGASGRVYCLAVGAVAVIGLGAFTVSFLALCGLMQAIGYSSTTAWLFPVIIDTAVAVSTLMLVALGDKPARRTRTGTASANAQSPTIRPLVQPPKDGAKGQARRLKRTGRQLQGMQAERVQTSASVQPDPAQTVQDSAHTEATQVDVGLASELIASGVTTQPLETVIAVLAASRDGASINAAAKASGINYRTAQRIVQAAADQRQRQLAVVS
jgi:Protein of unknown function (DUF2637)